MPDSIVQFDSVSKCFGRVKALQNLTFEVFEGEILGVIGPNGSGKTTTIRIMLGFYGCDAGAVRLFGCDPRRGFRVIGPQLGVMLEQPGLSDELTAAEYLDYYGGLFGMSRSTAAERRRRVLETVGLTDRADDRIRGFSKGMRQRVSLARCLLNHPRLLLLDEPFDGIDIDARRQITELLPRISAEEGTAILITSHNLPELEKVSNRIGIIHKGCIVALGSSEELRRRLSNNAVVVIRVANLPPGNELLRIVPGCTYEAARGELTVDLARAGSTRDEVLGTLLRHGASVVGVTETGATLEDVYFSLTGKGDSR